MNSTDVYGDLKGVSRLMNVVEGNDFESAFNEWMYVCANFEEIYGLEEDEDIDIITQG